MRCEDHQRILMNGGGSEPGGGPAAAAREHARTCPTCAAYAVDLATLEKRARALRRPAVPPTLDARTRRAIRKAFDAEARRTPLPRGMAIALAVLTAMTVVVVFPVIWSGEIADPLTFRSATAIALLLQNGVMLFVAPILFRRFGTRPDPSPERTLGELK
jgi:hypothetical protein